jgi:hypothetical protein
VNKLFEFYLSVLGEEALIFGDKIAYCNFTCAPKTEHVSRCWVNMRTKRE